MKKYDKPNRFDFTCN